MAIAGGLEQGMEVWDPATGKVSMPFPRIPEVEEDGDARSLQYSQMVAIDEGRDLLLYGGFQVRSPTDFEPG